jgi:hypothetical protein
VARRTDTASGLILDSGWEAYPCGIVTAVFTLLSRPGYPQTHAFKPVKKRAAMRTSRDQKFPFCAI